MALISKPCIFFGMSRPRSKKKTAKVRRKEGRKEGSSNPIPAQ